MRFNRINRGLPVPYRKTKQRQIRERKPLIQESWKYVMSLTMENVDEDGYDFLSEQFRG